MPVVKHHLGEVDGRDLYEQDGYIACECMGWGPNIEYHPCKHVWEAMKKRLDGHRQSDTLFAGMVVVPLAKEDVNGVPFVVEVNARPEEARHGMLPFYFVTQGLQEEFPFVGWLSPDEGRYAMRRVLMEFLRAQYREVTGCASSLHSVYLMSMKERKKLDMDDTAMSVLAAVASILSTGSCWRCLHGQSSSDLIPDI